MASEEDQMENKTCRVCMTKCSKYNIFRSSSKCGFLIHKLIIMITSLEISENDGLPAGICSQCFTELKIAISFKRKCLESDKQFRDSLKSTNNRENDSIKQEIPEKPDVFIKEEVSDDYIEPLCILNFNRDKIPSVHVAKRGPGRPREIKTTSSRQQTEYNCEFCEKQYRSKTELKKHLKKHNEVKSFQCRVCNKIFGQNSHLQRHLLIHTGLKPFSCDVCHKSFKQKPHLIRHVSVHTGVKPYQCEVCGKNFITPSDLNKHSIVHSGTRPFQCDVCGKAYHNTSDLNKHLARKHNYDTNRLKCEICEVRCDTKKALNQHVLIHCDSEDIWKRLDSKNLSRESEKDSLIVDNFDSR